MTNTTNTYMWSNNIEKSCLTCAHAHVCKYKEKTEEALKTLGNGSDGIGISNIKVKLECEYYCTTTWSYPTITWGNGNDVPDWVKRNQQIEITC